MNCPEVRGVLLDYDRDRLDPESRRELERHLEACVDCARERDAERALSSLLEKKLPRYGVSPDLKRQLALLATPSAARKLLVAAAAALGGFAQAMARARWARVAAPVLAVALVATVGVLVSERARTRSGGPFDGMVAEAVNDYLRILNSVHPFDIESSANHQVKPWFEGKLEFAPAVPLPAISEFRLEGGAVGYFLDRKAAIVAYRLRRHAVTMIVFPAQGFRWPPHQTEGVAGLAAYPASQRGFHVVFWRTGDLCYALVSDVDAKELQEVAAELARAT